MLVNLKNVLLFRQPVTTIVVTVSIGKEVLFLRTVKVRLQTDDTAHD